MAYPYYGQQHYGQQQIRQQPSEEWAPHLADALNFFVMPGCAVKIWVADEPVVVLKKANEFGQTDVQIYDLVLRKPQNAGQINTPVAQEAPAPVPVTREEFEALVARVDSLGKKPTKKEAAE